VLVVRRATALLMAVIAASAILGLAIWLVVDVVTSRSRDGKEILDGLERDVRSVTPTGAQELGITRYDCDDLVQDGSQSRRVERQVRMPDATTAADARDEVRTAFVDSGWERYGQHAVTKSNRVVVVFTGTRIGDVTLVANDDSLLRLC